MSNDKKPLYFVDYVFSLDHNDNIQFDVEVRPHMLNLNIGDTFKVEIVDDKVTFIKQNNV